MVEPTHRDAMSLRRTLVSLPIASLATMSTGWLAAPSALVVAVFSARSTNAAEAGGLTTREIDLPEFDTLILEVPAEVKIEIGDRNHVRIEAERKVIDHIEFKHEDRKLRVRPAGSFETRQPIAIHITCRRLKALQAHASVDAALDGINGDGFALVADDSATVTLKRLNLDSITADIEGSATVTVAGKSRSQQVNVGGSSTYDASALKSESAKVMAAGSSDVAIDSRDRLTVSVSGAATVRYAGSPKLEQSVEGAGTLERQ